VGGDVEFVQAGSGGGCARDNPGAAALGGASGGQVRKFVAGESGNTEAGPVAVTAQTYPIVVPAGGAGATVDGNGGAGSSCTGLGLTADGGVGSTRPSNATLAAGLPGYNASGASARGNVQGLGGVGTNRSGGDSIDNIGGTNTQCAGGGAGQTQDGANAVTGQAGNGGAGLKTSITGSEIGLGGGGGGGGAAAAAAGTATDGGGAGTNGASTAGANGTANRGGGAGGSRGTANGANGGSGYFAIRYPIAAPL